MSLCHNLFSFVPCGRKSSTVQPLILDNNRITTTTTTTATAVAASAAAVEITRTIGKEEKKNKEEEEGTGNKLNPTAPLRIPTKATPDSVKYQGEEEEDGTDGLIKGGGGGGEEKMVDIRSSSMIKPCLIGSPPPSVLRERSKFRRDRLTQSRLATDTNDSSQQPAEETVLHSTGETPAIHLSCSVDDSGPEDEDNLEIVALNPGTGVPLTERLTPPPRNDGHPPRESS